MTLQNYNPWKTLSSRVLHQTPWLTLYEDDVITPNGKPGTYAYTESPPFVLVIGHAERQFVMVRQYRYPLKKVTVELPGGNINEGESPLDAAKREFEEESGLVAQRWVQLGIVDCPNPATVFLAEELTDAGHNKMLEDGIADAIRVNWTDIDRMIIENDFTDAKTLAGLLLFERYQKRTLHDSCS